MKLNLGSGLIAPDKRLDGWTYVDIRPFEGVDIVHDLTKAWPWEDESVDEVASLHFIEHLTANERYFFFEELYRVLKPNGKAQIVTPHWSHERAYGDLDHKWPPVVPCFYSYLTKSWRDSQARHCPFKCNFVTDLAGTYDSNDTWVAMRTDEIKGVLMRRYTNTTTDLIANLTKMPLTEDSEK